MYLLYNVLLISTVPQSKSATGVHICPLFWISFPFRSALSTELSALCCSVNSHCCCSVAQSCLTLCDPMDCSMPGLPVHQQLPELAQTDIHWAGDAILSSVVPFSSHLQFFPASWSFLMSQLFASGGQIIGASASVLPVNIQDGFPLGWTGWISLQSKGLSRVFSSTTVQKHQFFGAQLSL